MNKIAVFALPIAFAAGFFAVGIPYWTIPYSDLSVPGTLMGAGLVVVLVAAILLRLFRVAGFIVTTVVMAASVPAAVFARVVWDGMKDPTSHNLWPIEIVFATPVGIGAAVAGALIGSLFAALLARPSASAERRMDGDGG